MGYDITYHPITRDELNRFIFDVIKNPGVANERAAHLSKNPDKRERIKTIYSKLPHLRNAVISGEYPFSGSYAYVIAGIAGYLHPYWYARGSCISFISEKDQGTGTLFKKYAFKGMLESLVSVAPDTFKGMSDKSKGLIEGNYTGSGYIDNKKLARLKDSLNNGTQRELVSSAFDEKGLIAINHAIDYAIANGAGLLEASDMVVPISNECRSDYDNLRADFMGTDENHINSREIE